MGMIATTTRLSYARNEYIKQGRSHIFDKVGDMIYYATLGGRLQVFFVDGAFGVDTYDAKTIATSRKTLTSALGLVTDNRQDYVFLRNYGNQATEDYPIDGTTWKKRVHIVGLEAYGGRYNLIDSAAAGTSAVDFSTTMEAAGTSFENIAFATSGTSTVPAVDFSVADWYITFRNCAFGWSGETARYGIYSASAVDTPHLVIDGCKFWGQGLNVAGIQLLGSSTRSQIINCDFIQMQSGDYGITDNGGTGLMDVLIKDNTFSVADAAHGEAIYLTGSGGCTIVGNRTGQGVAAMTNTPYCDSGDNDWGLNYYDIRAIMPVTSL